MPDPKFEQPEFLAEVLFGFVHSPDPFGCHSDPVGDAARQAGHGRFVPDRQVPVLGQVADVLFGHPDIQQWAANGVFAGGNHPGPVVPLVVDVGTVGDDIDVELRKDMPQASIKFGLAEVAAVGFVLQVVGIVELVGFDHDVANPNLLGQLFGLLPLATGQAGADGRHRYRVVTTGLLGSPGHHGAVDAGRKGHRDPTVAGQRGQQRLELLVQGRGESLGHRWRGPPRCLL